MGLSSTLHSVTLLSPLITLLLLSVAPPIVTSLFAATLVVAIISACASYLWIVDSNLLLAMATAVDPEYFRNKRVLITGASSGIGKAIAEELVSLDVGVRLILASRRLDVLEALATTLRARNSSNEIAVVQLDIGKLDAVPHAAAEVLDVYDGLDILVNNAGISTRAMAHKSPFALDERLMRIDFLGHVALTKELLPSLLAHSGSGAHIVNISSIAGKLGAALRSAYCAAKFALIGHFDAMRAELAFLDFDNISITNVCPGSVRTDVAKNSVLESGKRMGISDGNIASGMDARRCAALILRGMSHRQDELWISKFPKEKLALGAAHFWPSLANKLLKGGMAKQRMLGTLQFVERAASAHTE